MMSLPFGLSTRHRSRRRTRRGPSSSSGTELRFRPALIEALEARIQLDASSATLGVLSLNAIGQDFSIAHHDGYDSYSATAGSFVTVQFIGDVDHKNLLQLIGPVSFDVYPSGTTAPGGPSFSLGDGAELAVFSADTTTQTIWTGAKQFLVDDLTNLTKGVSLDGNDNSFVVDGSVFTPSDLQLVPTSSTNSGKGAQALMHGAITFNDAIGFSPTVTGDHYVIVGPESGVLLDGFNTTGGPTKFSAKGMDFQAASLSIDYESGSKTWTVTGELGFTTSSTNTKTGASATQFSFYGSLGYSGDNLPGLVFENGKFKSFALTLSVGTSSESLNAGMHIATGQQGKTVDIKQSKTYNAAFAVIYQEADDTNPDQFIAIGRAGYESEARPGVPFAPGFELDFGDLDQGTPGFTIVGGNVTEFAVGVTTAFGLGPVQVQSKDFGIAFNEGAPGADDDTLSFYGEVSVVLKSTWAGASVALGTSASDPGLVVNLDTGHIQLDDIQLNIQYIPLGAFIIQDVGFEYKSSDDGNFTIDAHGELVLPAGWGVGIDFRFDRHGLQSITGLFEAVSGNPGIEIGDTGLALNEVELSILNIDNPTDLAVQGSATFVYGDAFTITGYEVAPFVAVGSFYVDKHKLELDGTVYLLAYSTPGPLDQAGLTTKVWHSVIGQPAGASIDLDWGAGKYSLSVSNLPLYSCILVSGGITFDNHGDFVLSAEADVVVPTQVPFIGGKRLAGLDLIFAYDASEKAGFVAVWTDIDLVVKEVQGGFEYAFESGDSGKFSLIGSKAIGKLQDQAESYLDSSSTNDPKYSYTKSATIDAGDGTSGLTFQVQFPESYGQSVTLTLPDGTVVDVSDTDSATLAAQGIALVPGDDGTTRIVHISGSATDPTVPLPPGTYIVTLISPDNFDQEDVLFSTLLDYVPPTVITVLPVDNQVASTLTLPLAGTVAPGLIQGLNGKAKVRFFVDDDGAGYDGLQVGSAMVDLNDDGTWTYQAAIDLNGQLPSRTVRIYATIDDGTNPVVLSDYSRTVVTNPLFTGTINNVRAADGATLPGGLPGVRVYLDLNGNGIYDGPTYNEDHSQILDRGEPTAISDFRGDFFFDPSDWPQIQEGQTYAVTLQLPSEQYAPYVAPGDPPATLPPVAVVYYDTNGGSEGISVEFRIVAPTIITGTLYDSPSGDLLPVNADGVAGRVVTLMSGTTVVATTTTGPSGIYTFYNVPNGDYTVVLDVVPNTRVIGPATTPTITIDEPQQQAVGYNFVIQRLASISGTVSGNPVGGNTAVPLSGRTVYATDEIADFPDFSSPTGLNLVGSAMVSDTGTSLSLYQGTSVSAAAWLAQPLDSSQGFEATFQWQAGSVTDGFAFVIQAQSPTALGAIAGQLGYGGITQSLAVEFDAYLNPDLNDPSDNHISIHQGGNADENSALARILSDTLNFDIDDLGVHTARILYVNGTLQIYLNGSTTPQLSIALDLASAMGVAPGTPVYVGLTAGAGSGAGFVMINNLEVRQVVASAVTDSNGAYTISGLVPNRTYRVIEAVPPGWRQILPADPSVSYQFDSQDLGVNSGVPAAGDVNGDGLVDLAYVTVGPNQDPVINVIYGDGQGGVLAGSPFTVPLNLRASRNVASTFGVRLLSGHFYSAGRTSYAALVNSVVTAGQSSSPYFTVAFFDLDQLTYTATNLRFFNVPWAYAADDAAVADLDGDGLDDLMLSAEIQYPGNSTQWEFRLFNNLANAPAYSNGTVNTAPATRLGANGVPQSFAVGDFFGQGRAALAHAYPTGDPNHPFQVEIVSFNADGSLATVIEPNLDIPLPGGVNPADASPTLGAGDLDGDGRLDLIFLTRGPQNGLLSYALQSGYLAFTMAGETASYQTGTFFAGDQPRLIVDDLDGDGLTDLAFLSHGGTSIDILLNRGMPFLQQSLNTYQVLSTQSPWGYVMATDFNNDGLLDLFGVESDSDNDLGKPTTAYQFLSSAVNSASQSVTVGSGQAVAGVNFTEVQFTPGSVSGVIFGDSDRDGRRDGSERGVAGVRVYVDLNGNGLLDRDEPSTVTNALGVYRFQGLPDGSYKVRITPAIGQSATRTGGLAQDARPTATNPGGFHDFAIDQDWLRGLPDIQAGPSRSVALTARLNSSAPSGVLRYSLDPGAPRGAAIDPVTGRFTWTASPDQAGGTYAITIRVTLQGSRAVSETRTFRVTLPTVGLAPTLAPIADQTIIAGERFTLGVVADGHGQALRYSLDPGSPEGLAIDPGTGVLSWTPANRPRSQVVTVRVTDAQNPAMAATQSFRLTVQGVAPRVSLPGSVSLAPDGLLMIGGSFAAPAGTTWTASVDYGDGTPGQSLALNADGGFVLSHAYANAGTFTALVVVRDADGLAGIARVSVTVAQAAPQPVPAVPPQIVQVVHSGGTPQHPLIHRLTVVFDRFVNIRAGAFVLLSRAKTVIPLRMANVQVFGRSVAVLTFRGRPRNGRFTLITRADRIRDAQGQHPAATVPLTFQDRATGALPILGRAVPHAHAPQGGRRFR